MHRGHWSSGLMMAIVLAASAPAAAAPDGFEVGLQARLASKKPVDEAARAKSLFVKDGFVWFRWGRGQVALMQVPPAEAQAVAAEPAAPVPPATNPVRQYVEGWRHESRDNGTLPAGLPADFDNRAAESPILNQGPTRGTCWAHALASAMATNLKTTSHVAFVPTVEGIVSFARSQNLLKPRCAALSKDDKEVGEGAYLPNTLKAMVNASTTAALCSNNAFPYADSCSVTPRVPSFSCAAGEKWRLASFNHFQRSFTSRDARNTRLVETLLSLRRNVMLSVYVLGDWRTENAASGTIDVQLRNGKGERPQWEQAHAVTIVGYHHDVDPSKSYFIIKNSWGTDWGRSGYAHMAYDYVLAYAYSIDTITQMVPVK